MNVLLHALLRLIIALTPSHHYYCCATARLTAPLRSPPAAAAAAAVASMQQARALCSGHQMQQQLQVQQLSHHLQQLRRPAAPRQQQQQHPARAVAAAAKKRASPVATGLVSVLQDELKIEKERYRTPEAVLEGPPGGYELEDRPNCTVLLLTRSFGDAEDVVVEVDIDAQEAEEELESGGDPDDEEGPDADDAGLPPVTFTVNISKGDRIMAFACETDGEEVAINHVSLSDAPEAEDEDDLGDFAPYTGPVFGELDDTLQSAFRDYLEERGITGEFGAYLMELVHDKLEVEYMNWLQRAREFISTS